MNKYPRTVLQPLHLWGVPFLLANSFLLYHTHTNTQTHSTVDEWPGITKDEFVNTPRFVRITCELLLALGVNNEEKLYLTIIIDICEKIKMPVGRF